MDATEIYFFKSGEVTAQAFQKGKVRERVGTLARLWKSDKATPEDLLQHLKDPLQFNVVAKTLAVDNSGFPIHE